jgi:signal transduction histidine kinase
MRSPVAKVTQAEISAAKEAAEADSRSKSAFLANMSQEIRTPINGILGLAHLMRRGTITPVQPLQLDKIAASASICSPSSTTFSTGLGLAINQRFARMMGATWALKVSRAKAVRFG